MEPPGQSHGGKESLGKRSFVERLIEDARGLTVVVLDTHEPRVIEKEKEEPASEPVENHLDAPVASQAILRLTSLLSPNQIVFWNEPISKEVLLKRLVETIASAVTAPPEHILSELLKRENESSTFFNEGVAFPHVRVGGIKNPLLALGVASQGISDVQTEFPVKLIFLIIAPKEDPNVQIRILGMVSRLARNENFVEQMLKSDSSEKAWINLLAFEKDVSQR